MASHTEDPNELTRTLFRLSQEILAGEDLPTVLQAVVSAITDHSVFQRAALNLFHRLAAPDHLERTHISRRAFAGLTSEEAERIRAHPLPQEELKAMFQECFRMSHSYYIPHDQLHWRDHPGFIDEDRAHGTESEWVDDLLLIPMRIQGQLLGFISVDDPVDRQAPTPERLQPIETFANLAALAIAKARDIDALRRSQQRLRGIYSLSAELADADDLETLVERAMSVIVEGFHYDYGALLLIEEECLVLRTTHTTLPPDSVTLDRGATIPLDEGVTGWAARHQQTAWIRDARTDSRFIAAHPELRSELAVPIVDAGTTLGVLNIESTTVDGFDELDREMLEALADQLAVAIRGIRRREALETQAQRDALTGAANRHAFAELIEQERARSERTDRPLSLVLIDLDDFHRVNEQHGHLTGDAVLQRVARTLRAHVREVDTVVRYGGDEFLVLMPETSTTEATAACRRIEARLHELDVGLGERLDASIGISTWHPAEDRTLDEVIEEADRWMYRRKARG